MPSCYYSSNYFNARALFRRNAQRAGAALHELEVVPGDDLTVDVAVLKGSNERVILHISGTHGTEGFVGSAIQSAWLHLLGENNTTTPGQPTVIFVHALNPFGMAHYRRWNEEGIDLNRNCLFSPEGWQEVLERAPDLAGYESMASPLVNVQEPPSFLGSTAMFLRGLYYVATGQSTDVKRAIVAATYTNHKGIFYGGRKLAASHRLLRDFLSSQGYTKLTKKVLVVDVHSGLGPTGEDTIMIGDGAMMGSAQRIFRDGVPRGEPAPYDIQTISGSAGKGGASDGYELTRGSSDACYPSLFTEATWSLGLAQEFGTVPGVFVIKALSEENMAWHYAPQSRLPYAQAIYDTFAPQQSQFHVSALRRGLVLLGQAIEELKAN